MQLRSQRRGDLSRARWAIAYVLIDRAGWSLTRVAALLGKHHTAILHGWRESQRLLRTDEDFFTAVALLEAEI